jgi:hypothetical protein
VCTVEPRGCSLAPYHQCAMGLQTGCGEVCRVPVCPACCWQYTHIHIVSCVTYAHRTNQVAGAVGDLPASGVHPSCRISPRLASQAARSRHHPPLNALHGYSTMKPPTLFTELSLMFTSRLPQLRAQPADHRDASSYAGHIQQHSVSARRKALQLCSGLSCDVHPTSAVAAARSRTTPIAGPAR